MKNPKLNYFTGLALAAALWSAAPGKAQQQDQTSGNAQSSTNGVLVESPEQNTNAVSTATPTGSDEEQSRWERRASPLVVIGHNVELKAGESAEAVVVIGGSARVDGHVRDAVVAVIGDLDVEGDCDAAVAILGDLKVGPNAKIRHEAVAVGGKVEAADGAKIGEPPFMLVLPNWVKQWFLQCFLKMRPLAPQVGWVWVIAGVIFLLYVIIAVLFPKPIENCVGELGRRPATTFLIGLLTKLLSPLIFLILSATGIGLLVVPFAIAALFLCAIAGKVALLQWLGFKLGRHFGTEGLRNPLLALLLGALIISVFYLVPIVGLLVFAITAVWGLGAGVTAAFGAFRKELPEKPAAPAIPAADVPAFGAGQGSPAGSMGGAPGFSQQAAGFSDAGGSGTATMTAPAATAAALVMPEALAFPKAGFWERMAAGFLDFVLIGVLGAVAHPIWPLIGLAYFTGMWAWKGTTIGGIVLGLKVVRLDGRPATFLVSLVRALAAAFSMIVLFLGFLWIAWDPEKQGWHDKIAGTVVLKLPRGTPLLML